MFAYGLAIFWGALLLFLVAWHLLTKYRVNIYVRFLNVPSPEQVFEKAVRAFHDPRFFSHVILSCRRILIGFAIAAVTRDWKSSLIVWESSHGFACIEI